MTCTSRLPGISLILDTSACVSRILSSSILRNPSLCIYLLGDNNQIKLFWFVTGSGLLYVFEHIPKSQVSTDNVRLSARFGGLENPAIIGRPIIRHNCLYIHSIHSTAFSLSLFFLILRVGGWSWSVGSSCSAYTYVYNIGFHLIKLLWGFSCRSRSTGGCLPIKAVLVGNEK